MRNVLQPSAPKLRSRPALFVRHWGTKGNYLLISECCHLGVTEALKAPLWVIPFKKLRECGASCGQSSQTQGSLFLQKADSQEEGLKSLGKEYMNCVPIPLLCNCVSCKLIKLL